MKSIALTLAVLFATLSFAQAATEAAPQDPTEKVVGVDAQDETAPNGTETADETKKPVAQ